jgi:hypothetical protein
MNNLAALLDNQGKYDEATWIFSRYIQIRIGKPC